DGEVQVGLLGPLLGSLEDLALPSRGRAKPGSERGKQIARRTTEVGAVRLKADGDQSGMGPNVARRRVSDDARLQRFDHEAGTEAAGALPWDRLGLGTATKDAQPPHW